MHPMNKPGNEVLSLVEQGGTPSSFSLRVPTQALSLGSEVEVQGRFREVQGGGSGRW